MTSKIHKHQKNNFKIVSKSTFIHFGILIVAMIGNSVFANNLTKEQNSQESNVFKTELVVESNNNTLKKPPLDSESDNTLTMASSYKKTIEEVIAEDNKIIESDIENKDISTIEKVILEDNQIIESDITKEVFPLDFDILNIAFSKF